MTNQPLTKAQKAESVKHLQVLFEHQQNATLDFELACKQVASQLQMPASKLKKAIKLEQKAKLRSEREHLEYEIDALDEVLDLLHYSA